MRSANFALLALLTLPTAALAWEPVAADGNPRAGVYAITTITDVVVDGTARFLGLVGQDMAEACRLVTGRGPNDGVNELHQNRFMPIGRRASNDVVALMPVVLFARAHNARVMVVVEEFNRECSVVKLRTCFDPTTCP